MRKLLIIALGFGIHFGGFAQTMRASIGQGVSTDKVIIYIRPDAAVNGTISTLAFNIAVPSSASATTPSVTQTLLAGFVWVLGAPYDEGGYRHWSLTTGSSPTVSIGANVETAVMEITFTGGGAGVSNAYLITLPDGGVTDGNALFYCSGAASSNGSDLYYTRTGPPQTIVSNGFSYRQTPDGTSITDGTDISYATMAVVVTPVIFTRLDATCIDKGASITWATASEQNSKQFDIERSGDGITWRTIGSVPAAGNSSSTRNYNYLDLEGGAALYRIRQKDLDGRSVLTEVKRTNCTSADFNVVLYPVPTKDNLTVVIRSDKELRTDIQVIDMKGSILRRIPTQINKGNNTFNLVLSDLPAGQYMLRSADASGVVNKKFTIAR